MTAVPSSGAEVVERPQEAPHEVRAWVTIVWDDPVNLMSYVSYVFRTYFGFSRERAEELMLTVHHSGHAVVAEGARELMELHTQAMHDFGLFATVRKATS